MSAYNFSISASQIVRSLTDLFRARRDEALWTRESSEAVVSSIGKHTREDDEEADIMMEANRIAQRMKSEMGPRGSQYDEEQDDPAWPTPPMATTSLFMGPSASLPMSMPPTSSGADSALKAFEEKKRLMESSPAKFAATQQKGTKQPVSSATSSSSSSSSSSDSSSSSSSDSSSSSSSSEDSSSDNSSSSSSDDSSDSSGTPAEEPVRVLASQDWVPPGDGLARTQRNNRSRRQKRKAKEDEMKKKLFQEAKARAEKRQNGKAVDEKATEKAWMVDTRGTKQDGHAVEKQRFAVVARDAELVLPPGGGSLGIEQKKKATKKATSNQNLQKVESEGSSKQSRDTAKQKTVSGFKTARDIYNDVGNLTQEATEDYSRYPPPPSLRNAAIPAGVRLTSVDCDDYYNNYQDQVWVDESDDVNEAYAAFQAQAKASLQAAKEKEELLEEQERELLEEKEQIEAEESVRMEIRDIFDYDKIQKYQAENNKEKHQAENNKEKLDDKIINKELEDRWLDGDNLWETDVPKERDPDQADLPDEVDDEDKISPGTPEGEIVTTIYDELPQAFGKKANWDGNEVVVQRKNPPPSAAAPSSMDDLDYGEPEDVLSNPKRTPEYLRKLREIRDQTKATIANDGGDALQKARLAALATRKKANGCQDE